MTGGSIESQSVKSCCMQCESPYTFTDFGVFSKVCKIGLFNQFVLWIVASGRKAFNRKSQSEQHCYYSKRYLMIHLRRDFNYRRVI